MIRESLYFTYAGKNSYDYNIMNVSVGQSEYKETFLANRKIDEVYTNEREEPYFMGIKREPLHFTLQFYFEEGWDGELIKEVAQWLNQETYQPLTFSENKDKVYYAMPIDNIEIIHNGLKQGYLELNMRCNTFHAYSKEVKTQIYDLTQNGKEGTIIDLTNYGDLNIKPDIWLKKIGKGEDLRITNTNNSGIATKFNKGTKASSDLYFTGTVYDGETITIGDKVYEFDTGDGIVNSHVKEWISGNLYLESTIINKRGVLFKCLKRNEDKIWDETKWEKLDKSNIKVDVSEGCQPSSAVLKFNQSAIKDGDTITIGNNTYEFDVDNVYNAKNGNIPINIKNYCKKATGDLIARSNVAFTNSQITIGEKTYHILPTSGEESAIISGINLLGFNNFLLDYDGYNLNEILAPTLLMNEKRDNSLNGLRVPYVDTNINKNMKNSKQIISLYGLTKMTNIPNKGNGDMGKYYPRLKGITGQTVGDELTIFKRGAMPFWLNRTQSTKETFVTDKNAIHTYQTGITDSQKMANEGDIILLIREPFIKTNFVNYNGRQYSGGDFEFLRVKNCRQNDGVVGKEDIDAGNIIYELENPSELFQPNLIYTYGKGHAIYGNKVDITNAKTIFHHFGYKFVETEKISEEELKSMIKTGDIIVGDIGAKDGVSFDVEGVERIGGKDRYITERLMIEKAQKIWASNTYQDTYEYFIILFHKQTKKIMIEDSERFIRPYQIRQGQTLDETCQNIVKAINEEGKDWVEYSKGTYRHEDVRASYDKNNKTIKLIATKEGSIGNDIVTVVNDWEDSQIALKEDRLINQFKNNTLIGGSDTTYSTLDDTNGKSLIAYVTEVLKTNEDKMNIDFIDNKINVKSKIYGSINNIIPVMTDCIACNWYDIKDNPTITLDYGKDPNINIIINKLKNVINTIDNKVIAIVDLNNKKVNIEYKEIGKQGNIPISTSAINSYFTTGKRLCGGMSELMNDEEVCILGEKGYIEGKINGKEDIEIYDKFNNNYLELTKGVNKIIVKGKCFIQFRCQYKLL